MKYEITNITKETRMFWDSHMGRNVYLKSGETKTTTKLFRNPNFKIEKLEKKIEQVKPEEVVTEKKILKEKIGGKKENGRRRLDGNMSNID